MGTIGNATQPSSSIGTTSGVMFLQRVQSAAAQTLNSIQCWSSCPNANWAEQIYVIYSDDAGAPDALLGRSPAFFTSPETMAQRSANLINPVVLSNGAFYWIGTQIEHDSTYVAREDYEGLNTYSYYGTFNTIPSDLTGIGSVASGTRFGFSGTTTSGAAIDTYPSSVRSGQAGIAYTTSGIASVTAITVGSLAATSISDTAGDGTHSLPTLVDETVHELFGTKTISFNAGAATVSREFLPPTGNDFVVLSGTINTATGAVGADFSPAVVVGDQIVKPVELDIDEQGNILGDDGVYTIWHMQASTKIARSYKLTLGDLEEDAPPVMPADTSVNIPENSTAVGTYAAVSGTSPITYSLGGPDAALYSINSTTALVTRNVGKDYEAGVNTNTITVIGTNAIDSDSMTLTINITNVIESPVMPGDRTYKVYIGNTIVGNGGAESGDEVIYSKSGDDHALFNINSATGGLSFISPPEIGGTYSVTITATNSVGTSSQVLTIIVVEKQNSTDKFFKAKFF